MSKYSEKINVPQYNPIGIDWKKNKKLAYDTTKYDQLVKRIDESNVGEKQKKFLKMAATRHIVFDYSIIAEYYCCANKEMQELMEESALVIIDVDDAIANGYVRLSKRIEEIVDGKKVENDEK